MDDLKRHKFGFAALTYLFSAMFVSAEVLDGSDAALSAGTWTDAQAVLVNELRDPTSALFQNLKVISHKSRDSRPTHICGEINGKNGFGGYAGFKPFLYEINTKSVNIAKMEYFDGSAMGQLALMPFEFTGCLRHLQLKIPR